MKKAKLPPLRKRLVNIVTRVAAGEHHWISGSSPRISNAEIAELDDLGFHLQSAAGTAVGDVGGRVVYALDSDAFKNRARDYGLIKEKA